LEKEQRKQTNTVPLGKGTTKLTNVVPLGKGTTKGTKLKRNNGPSNRCCSFEKGTTE